MKMPLLHSSAGEVGNDYHFDDSPDHKLVDPFLKKMLSPFLLDKGLSLHGALTTVLSVFDLLKDIECCRIYYYITVVLPGIFLPCSKKSAGVSCDIDYDARKTRSGGKLVKYFCTEIYFISFLVKKFYVLLYE